MLSVVAAWKSFCGFHELNVNSYFASFKASEQHLKKHYEELKDKKFFPGLVKYMSSGPVVAMVSHLNLPSVNL